MATQLRPLLVDEPGVWFGIATGLLVTTFLVSAATGLDAIDTACAAIVVAGLTAARIPGLPAAALGLVGWAFWTGFTENTFGQLTLAGGDLARLVGFVAATVLIAYAVHQAATAVPARSGDRRDG